jgi:hypothetical protein
MQPPPSFSSEPHRERERERERGGGHLELGGEKDQASEGKLLTLSLISLKLWLILVHEFVISKLGLSMCV